MIGRRQFFERCGQVLLFSRSIGSCFGVADNSEESCGIDPFKKRIMFSRSLSGIPQVWLAAIYLHDGRSLIKVSQQNRLGKAESFYSVDKGNTWNFDPFNTSNYTNLNIRRHVGFTGIADGRNPSVLYRVSALKRIEVSTNSGAQWDVVSPKFNDNNIESIELVGTGGHAEGRLYAGISWAGDINNYAMCRSDDYGRSFTIVSTNLTYVVESRANPNVLIGMSRPDKGIHHEIVISLDCGVSWRKTKADILREHLFRNDKEDVIRTDAESKEDIIFHNYNLYIQIESDPIDARTFYVVTWTGLYVTFDQGETFRLLPIGGKYIYDVDCVAVDPIDSRYIYAAVKGSNLQYSADKGCTWAGINMPGY